MKLKDWFLLLQKTNLHLSKYTEPNNIIWMLLVIYLR